MSSPLMFWPSEAHRKAALVVALFENEYAKLVIDLTRIGKTPPSREVILEEARRHPSHTPYSLVAAKRVRLAT